MSSIGRMFDQLNFFAASSVIATTALTVIFFEKYAKKKLPPADGSEQQPPVEEIHAAWYAGLFLAELYGQFTASKTLDATDAVFATLLNFAGNILVFFICYKILGVIGVDKENLYARCKKAFMGLVILSFALMALVDYVGVPTSQSVPANTAAVSSTKPEFVMTSNGVNIYIDRKSLVRIGNVHEDAAPEFKCVLIDDADIRTNCEFHARGAVVMFVDGIAVGDSIENPEIEKLYDAIVKKFL